MSSFLLSSWFRRLPTDVHSAALGEFVDTKLDNRFKQRDETLNVRFEQSDAGFEGRMGKLEGRFEGRLDKMDAKWDGRFEQVSIRLDARSELLDMFKESKQSTDERIVKLEALIEDQTAQLIGMSGLLAANRFLESSNAELKHKIEQLEMLAFNHRTHTAPALLE